MEIKDVKAIVTGAASGIGKCFTLELARKGALVYAADINEDALLGLESELEDLDLIDRVKIAPLDITKEKSVIEFVNKADGEFNSINTLVNNAGILRDGMLVKKEAGWISKLPAPQWQKVIDTNLTGHFYMSREIAAKMMENEIKSGLIVNISSISKMGNPGQSNYAASKAGLDADTRTWALELAPHGIRVAGIAPGIVDTPILDHIEEDHLKKLVSKIPVGRMGDPYEIWLALQFIIQCEFFTGRILEVDGGDNF